MSATSAHERIVLSDGRVDPDKGRPLRLANCLPAFAIGLIAPAAAVLVLDPTVMLRMAYVLPGMLLPLMLVAIAIYAYCVLVPGEVAAISADPAERTVTIVEANLFARRRTELAFADVADIRMANGYDADGYATHRAELVLRTGDTVGLPAWVGEAESVALRRAVRGGRA